MDAQRGYTLTERLPMQPRCVIGANDGFGNARAVAALIMVDAAPVDTATNHGDVLRVDELREWVDTYLDGKDLTRTLDFTPTARNLALYLAGVFRGIDPSVCTVHVGFDGGITYRVDC